MLKATSGSEKRELYQTHKTYIQDVRAIDIFYLDLYQDDTMLEIEKIKSTADQFVNVFSTALMDNAPSYEHRYFELVMNENNAITKHFDEMKKLIKQPSITKVKNDLLSSLITAEQIATMFEKRENILFANLEDKAPSNKPFQVLWELHNDARELLKKLIRDLKSQVFDEKAFLFDIGQFYFLLYGIIQKHELIILPLAKMFLDDNELDTMKQEMFHFGFAFINPIQRVNGQTTNPTKPSSPTNIFESKTGNLNFKQIEMLFKHIPIDITYVNKENKVEYYNDRKERHFPRNPSIIGRLVENCHPPKSVHIVQKIIQDFKDGKEDFAEFYIRFKDTYLYITYYPVRDDNGNYEGVLEVSQDITRINKLSGEKRLLES
jgi:DUF438 domain-containing protein